MPGRVAESDRHEARRRWLTTSQVGDRLGVSAEHVRQLIASGDLRAMDVSRAEAKSTEYRIRPEWVDAFEESRTSGPNEAA